MDDIRVRVCGYELLGRLGRDKAPKPLIICGYSESELLIPYGGTDFSSKVGQLTGNHFLTIVEKMIR